MSGVRCINKAGAAALLTAALIMLGGCSREYPQAYEQNTMQSHFRLVTHSTEYTYRAVPFARDLCLPEVSEDAGEREAVKNVGAAGLFDLNGRRTLRAQNLTERIYPASTTKLMTAYMAMKYGDMSKTLKVKKSTLDLPWDAQQLGLNVGDQMTMEQALNYLLVFSANDCANLIAEEIGGSQEEFAKMMTEEAHRLGATDTNFRNAHGLHDPEHYTTAYDLYLILNADMQFEDFAEIIHQGSYDTAFKDKNGNVRSIYVNATDEFLSGAQKAPKGITVIGGKTGTTDEAGANLIILSVREDAKPYISVILNAADHTQLYRNMYSLLEEAVGDGQ